jgi:hypothetical protein
MSQNTAADNQRENDRENSGEFGKHEHSRPEVELVWVVEGDDHEVVVVEARNADDALDVAWGEFSSRYGGDEDEDDEDGYGRDSLDVAGAFSGDIDDTDSLVFVPQDSYDDEKYARRALRNLQ